MKTRRPLKGLADIKKQAHQSRTYPITPPRSPARVSREESERRRREAEEWLRKAEAKAAARDLAATTSPLTAHAAETSYRGPNMPDKGKRDGSCNVTACQMPLLGKPQFIMREPWCAGELYYCKRCNDGFRKWDEIDRPGTYRCEPDPRNAALEDEYA